MRGCCDLFTGVLRCLHRDRDSGRRGGVQLSSLQAQGRVCDQEADSVSLPPCACLAPEAIQFKQRHFGHLQPLFCHVKGASPMPSWAPLILPPQSFLDFFCSFSHCMRFQRFVHFWSALRSLVSTIRNICISRCSVYFSISKVHGCHSWLLFMAAIRGSNTQFQLERLLRMTPCICQRSCCAHATAKSIHSGHCSA